MEDRLLPDHIEQLLLTKGFEELSGEEKEQVAVHLSEIEYKDFRLVLGEGKLILQEPISVPDKKALLMKQFDVVHHQPKMKRLLTLAVPLYQVAALLIFIFGIFAIIGQEVISSSDNNKIYVYLTDTIYKEVLVPDKIWLADSSTRNSFYDYDTDVAYVGESHETKDGSVADKANEYYELSDADEYLLAKRSGLIPEVDIEAVNNRNRGGRSLREDSVWRKYLVVSF